MIAGRAHNKFASENMRCLWLLLSLVTVTMMGSRSAVANTLIAAACVTHRVRPRQRALSTLLRTQSGIIHGKTCEKVGS